VKRDVYPGSFLIRYFCSSLQREVNVAFAQQARVDSSLFELLSQFPGKD